MRDPRVWLCVVILACLQPVARAEIGFETGTLSGTIKTNGDVVPPSFSYVRATSAANGSSATGFVIRSLRLPT